MLLLFPVFHGFQQPGGKFIHAFPGFGRYRDDACLGIPHMDILLALLKVKVEVRLNIHLVHHHYVADGEHQGVLERFVVAFRNGEDHGVA